MYQERDIGLYMFLRLVMLFSVLFSAVLYQSSGVLGAHIVINTYTVIFLNFLVTSIFIFGYDRIAFAVQRTREKLPLFLGAQVAYDILFTTILIFYTGPFDSIYTVFYLLNIIFTAILFRVRGALLAALLSASLYFCVAWGSSDFVTRNEKFFSVLTTMTAFVAIGLLSGQLVEEATRSRQKISRLEKLNEEIVDSLDSGLLGLDQNNTIQKINKTAANLLAIKNIDSVVGKPYREVLPALGDAHLISGQIKELVIQGQVKRILITRVELVDQHSMILLRDLSEVLDLEQKIQRQEHLAGIGRLATGVAHEIRNPVASMSGAAQLLTSHSELDSEAQKLINIIIRESERVDRLVAQLLQFAKPSSSKKESLDISYILKESIDALATRPDFQKSKVKIDIQIQDGLITLGSKDQLQEVVSNLLINALQALDSQDQSKPRKIRVEGRRLNNHVEIVVADNGPGIPREFRERIFDPFFTTKPTGTGLGLAQVHKIIREHEGQIDVETEEGKGTSLRVRIPA